MALRQERVKPKAPVLIIAPGDLHQQFASEGLNHFGIVVRYLDSQATFDRLTRAPGSVRTNLTADGRPIIEPAFYLITYTQLASNGVAKLPDAYDWEPRALLEWLALQIGNPRPTVPRTEYHLTLPPYEDVCHFFSWRGAIWRDEFDLLNLDPRDTRQDLDRAFERAVDALRYWEKKEAAAAEERKLQAAYGVLQNLMCNRPDPRFSDLNARQEDFVIREFCAAKIAQYEEGTGTFGPAPEPGVDAAMMEDTRPVRRVKCVFSPSLADLCYNAFDCVVVDEGVKMKGEETLIGRGVRSMTPTHRLVLTATPIKNRLPDVFRLAWWATGGKAEAHARFPYRDDTSERTKFAETFLVCERNLTREAKAEADGKKAGGRFKKQTAEVCNVHKLWKLFGPIVLRRRKEDAGVDIVPRIRKVIRCEMGTMQKKVYQYHLDAEYRDKNGRPAIGAQLQALRIAAADPTSVHLESQPGQPTEPCGCQSSSSSSSSSKCPICKGKGELPLPPRSGNAYVPKMATVLTLIHEILERKEQVLVGSAFNDPLDNLSHWLNEAGVRHIVLDGRTSQKKRGEKAARFKQGRDGAGAIPVTLAGVESMAEGHSFNLCNNVILLAYSWAADKFKQFLDRVWRLNSFKPVNVYVVLCQGTVDRKLESLTNEKTDAAELVLDGRLIGERLEEVNLAELLKIAKREFNTKDNTIDEALLSAQWPALRAKLTTAMRAWEPEEQSAPALGPAIAIPMARSAQPLVPSVPLAPLATSAPPSQAPCIPAWKLRLFQRAGRLAQLKRADQ